MRLYRVGNNLLLVVCLFLAGCISLQQSPTYPIAASQTPGQHSPAAPPVVAPTTGGQPTDTGWVALQPGMDMRTLQVFHNERLAMIQAVRFDPALVVFRAGYVPDTPPTIAHWCNQAGVLAAINGGFFETTYHPSALVISDGVSYGHSYQGLGGMFAVDAVGNVSLRYLGETPYHPDELLTQAIQSWPMLVLPGGRLGYANPDNGEYARRSVLAMDRAGRVILLAFSSSVFRLHELGTWLLASDMEIDSALNLDGGSSTGLCINNNGDRSVVQAFSPLPLALLVYRR